MELTSNHNTNGHCYTVVPCYVSDSSRTHYCGAYAKDFKTWRVIDELAPKESSLIAWDVKNEVHRNDQDVMDLLRKLGFKFQDDREAIVG